MTWARARAVSLLDTVDASPVEWWLIYSDFERPHWYGRFLTPGFQHVTAMRRDGRVWVHLSPNIAFVDIDVLRTDATPYELFPSATLQRVIAMRPLGQYRTPLQIGPMTCVEICKAVLGIPDFFLWTPHQLYKFCASRQGLLTWAHRRKLPSQPRKNSPCSAVRLKS